MNRRRFFKLVGGGVAGGATFGSGVGTGAAPEEPRLLVAPPKQFIEPWTPSPYMEDLLNQSRHVNGFCKMPVAVQASWWEGGHEWIHTAEQTTQVWICDGIAKIADDLSFQIDSVVGDPGGITLVVFQMPGYRSLAQTMVHVSGLTGKIEIINDGPMLIGERHAREERV